MKRKEKRRHSLYASLCVLISLCVYGYDWI